MTQKHLFWIGIGIALMLEGCGGGGTPTEGVLAEPVIL